MHNWGGGRQRCTFRMRRAIVAGKDGFSRAFAMIPPLRTYIVRYRRYSASFISHLLLPTVIDEIGISALAPRYTCSWEVRVSFFSFVEARGLC